MASQKTLRRLRIKRRIRKRIAGTAQKPRLAVYRSNKVIYVQLIDDTNGHTLLSTSSKTAEKYNAESAKAVGVKIAELAIAKGISTVVFDRGGFLYHGKVKALGEGAREGGLQF